MYFSEVVKLCCRVLLKVFTELLLLRQEGSRICLLTTKIFFPLSSKHEKYEELWKSKYTYDLLSRV